MSLKSLSAVILVTMVVSVLSSVWLVRRSLSAELEKLNLLTPVFVIDRAGWARTLPKDANPAQINQAMQSWQTKITHLADSGFIVLDTNMVVSAPEDVYVGD